MRFSYIFWDNDGVLVDTERLYYQASREALAQLQVNLPHELFTDISLAQGRSVFDLASDAGHSAERLEELRDWRNARYMELLAEGDLVIPGVRETLQALHRKVGMAVVTSSHPDHFAMIHRRSGLLPYFDFVLSRFDYGNSKPDPEPYLLALTNSKTPAEQCLVIEDSPRGLAAAIAAGLTCWVIPSPETDGQDFTGADRILNDIKDILTFIEF